MNCFEVVLDKAVNTGVFFQTNHFVEYTKVCEGKKINGGGFELKKRFRAVIELCYATTSAIYTNEWATFSVFVENNDMYALCFSPILCSILDIHFAFLHFLDDDFCFP